MWRVHDLNEIKNYLKKNILEYQIVQHPCGWPVVALENKGSKDPTDNLRARKSWKHTKSEEDAFQSRNSRIASSN